MPEPFPATFDDRRCITCGAPWDEHQPSCSRHEYRPPEPTRHVFATGMLAYSIDVPRLTRRVAKLEAEVERLRRLREELRTCDRVVKVDLDLEDD